MRINCWCKIQKQIQKLEKELKKNSQADQDLSNRVDEIEEHGIPPGPDSVGSEEIKDDSILMDDLSQEVKDKMSNSYDGETLYLNTPTPQQNNNGDIHI